MLSADAVAGRPDLAQRLAREERALLVRQSRTACWFCIVLIPLFHALDAILLPHLVVPFLFIRATVVALAILVLFAAPPSVAPLSVGAPLSGAPAQPAFAVRVGRRSGIMRSSGPAEPSEPSKARNAGVSSRVNQK